MIKIISTTIIVYGLCFSSVSAQATKAGSLMLGGYTAYAEKCQSFTRQGLELKTFLISEYKKGNPNHTEDMLSGYKMMIKDGCATTRKALKSLERQDPSVSDFHQSLFGGIK